MLKLDVPDKLEFIFAIVKLSLTHYSYFFVCFSIVWIPIAMEPIASRMWICANLLNYFRDVNSQKRISVPFRLESLCKQDVRINTAKPYSTFHKGVNIASCTCLAASPMAPLSTVVHKIEWHSWKTYRFILNFLFINLSFTCIGECATPVYMFSN